MIFHLISRCRAAAFAVWFYGITVAFCVASLVLRAVCPQYALPYAQAWARTALAGLRPLCGIRLSITGMHHIPRQGPALIASQHQSEFDTLIWMALLGRPAYVMKQELTRIPLFGRMLLLSGMIPVDRTAGAGALRALLTGAQAARDDNRQLVVFPEGTRVPPGTAVPLHPGIVAIATRLNLPVIPIATNSGEHWPRNLLHRPSGIIHIAIAPPILSPFSRQTLLEQIETHWQQSKSSNFQLVDNHVDNTQAITIS